MIKERLLSPGPTPVPSDVLLELAKPLFHHRTQQYRDIHKEAIEGLKAVFKTGNDTFILTSSGTGAMESSVVNLLSPGDKAIVIEGGKFGQRWTELCKTYNIESIVIEVPWGEDISSDVVAEHLKNNPDAKAVFATHCETSTGVGYDIEAIGKVVSGTDAVLVVDGISGVGTMPMKTDEWGVDMLCVGSQKALMLPPGLAFITVSEKAWKVIAANKNKSYYFNLNKAKKSIETYDNPFTPALTLVLALNEALKKINAEGVENIWAHSAFLADATRKAIQAMGLEIFANAPAESVTAIKLPEDIDGGKVPKIMRDKHGFIIAGGQAKLKGKICRIAHMGYIDKYDLLACLSALEATLVELGAKINVGEGVKTFHNQLMNA